jgi:hypothetical protein
MSTRSPEPTRVGEVFCDDAPRYDRMRSLWQGTYDFVDDVSSRQPTACRLGALTGQAPPYAIVFPRDGLGSRAVFAFHRRD